MACACYWMIIFALELMQVCQAASFYPALLICMYKGTCTLAFPFRSVSSVAEAAMTLKGFFCFPFFFQSYTNVWMLVSIAFFLPPLWWLWSTKGEGMLSKLFIRSKGNWKSLFLLSNCINEKEAQRKRLWLETEQKHQPDFGRGEVTEIFISTNIC